MNDLIEFPNNDYPIQSSPKRHGFVTFWLIFIIVMGAIGALMYTLASTILEQRLKISGVMITAIVLLCLFNIACSILLLSWKKIGFYGFVVSDIVGFVININMRIPFTLCAIGITGFIISYAILQIKKNGVSAWNNLK